MEYKASLYFNYPSFKDTVFIVIDQEKRPDLIKKNGDFVSLYNNNELIGVNIFNSNKYFKLKIEGQLQTFNKVFDDLINLLLKSYINEDVRLVESNWYLAQVINKKDNLYTLKIKDGEIIAQSFLNENIENESYVLFIKRDSFLENGKKVSSYLQKGVLYLIVAIENDELSSSSLGLSSSYIS